MAYKVLHELAPGSIFNFIFYHDSPNQSPFMFSLPSSNFFFLAKCYSCDCFSVFSARVLAS